MSELYTHKCPCGVEYTDTDPDVYFCASCVLQRKEIAKEIDAKLAGSISKKEVKSDFQVYDEMCKKRGVKFINARDLGISL